MSFRLGLTGSIGMGKSTTAALFAEEGCAVWDADAAVHHAYAQGGMAVDPIGALFPEAVVESEVSRDALKRRIAEDPGALARIEAIVHPIVAEDRRRAAAETRADIIVFDIPLLFETGADAMMDATVCVTVDEATRRARVLARPGMTEAQFEAIVAKQMPSAEKEARADHVVVTDTPEHARAQVRKIVAEVREKMANA